MCQFLYLQTLYGGTHLRTKIWFDKMQAIAVQFDVLQGVTILQRRKVFLVFDFRQITVNCLNESAIR